ncbi:ATP-dependent RNA helicase RhlE [Actinomadura verrucosospora]|uniref:ATP-dependent RNA helicase RhlE n=1 Tax=Actinomadura verrucosospora TaxID=46165 RepID=A0A7D4A5K2_ACTVE|nr:ATP-dependent RNA helicase RhlE [Actinomadura verrucosospora]
MTVLGRARPRFASFAVGARLRLRPHRSDNAPARPLRPRAPRGFWRSRPRHPSSTAGSARRPTHTPLPSRSAARRSGWGCRPKTDAWRRPRCQCGVIWRGREASTATWRACSRPPQVSQWHPARGPSPRSSAAGPWPSSATEARSGPSAVPRTFGRPWRH